MLKKALFACLMVLSVLIALGIGIDGTSSKAISAVSSLPVSSSDRVYTADQTSNTVSVINPATNTLLGRISLGNPRPNVLSPLY